MNAKASVSRLIHTGLENYDHAKNDVGAMFFSDALAARVCPCCAKRLVKLEHELPATISEPGTTEVRWLVLEICPACGWWHYQRQMAFEPPGRPGELLRSTWWELTHALQAEIDLASETLPIASLQQHLARRWEDRKLISAQQAEDLVAALLKEHHGGEVVRLTANANAPDGGIDLYLSQSSDGAIQRAVQVKRRIANDVEAVKEVRNFVGAMVWAGIDQGIFVTTASRFSKAAQEGTRLSRAAKHKLELELIDGEGLLEMLHATTVCREVQLPPLATLDQVWRHESGRSVSALDLFCGDLERALLVR